MCLNKIIGISNNDCDCIEENTIENTSISGYYINDILESGSILKLDKSLSCDDQIWKIYEAAKIKAIDDFKTNLLGYINQYNSKIVEWSGTVGNPEKANKIITNSPSVLILPITPRSNFKNVKLTIRVGFKAADAGIISISLFNESDPTALHTWSINTVSNTSVYGDFFTIDMYSNGIPQNYRLEVTFNGVRGMETKTYCCSGPGRWANFINLTQRYMQGVLLDLKLHCGSDWICADLDFEENPWAKAMARTILYMARVSIYTYILSSSKINKYSLLLEPQHLMGKIKNLNKEIELRMEWLSNNIPESAKDCWACNSNIKMGQIIV
jgi:hypothetical protein